MNGPLCCGGEMILSGVGSEFGAETIYWYTCPRCGSTLNVQYRLSKQPEYEFFKPSIDDDEGLADWFNQAMGGASK